MATLAWVFDIDGTLANGDHRLHHIQKVPKDWTAYFAEVGGDAPIPHMIKLLTTLAGEAEVVLVSGRSDECRDATLSWIKAATDGYEFPLYMRRAGDYRDDGIVKIELLAQMRADGFEPIMVFDDRTRVVKAFRAAGVPCAQVAEGDF